MTAPDRSSLTEAPPANPISPGEFKTLMDGLTPTPGPDVAVAVAVSGGADSMALVRLADAWAQSRGSRAVALTVNHGLRPGADAETAQVSRWMAKNHIAHEILRWQGAKPKTGIQAAAREARYALLCGWCRDHNIPTLLLAHHQGDQAETVLMRLNRGSGADGLAAMASNVERGGIQIVRPLLAVPKARLQATCAALNQKWIEDPSNRDPRYGRTHARNRLAALAKAGLDPAALADAAREFGVARAARDGAVGKLLTAAATEFPEGYIVVNVRALADAPQAVAMAALSRILCRVSGAMYGPRTTRLTALHRAVASGLDRARTLHRCLLDPQGTSELLICRESRNLPSAPLPAGSDFLWDRRFQVTLDAHTMVASPRIGPLGAAGWRQIRPENGRNLAPAVRKTLPVLWQGDRVVSGPILGLEAPDAGFSTRFSSVQALLPIPFAVVSRAEIPIFTKVN